MSPIDSIYEVKEAFFNLQKYLASKDPLVLKKARVKYEQLVDVFLRGNKDFETTKHRQECLNDQDFFMKLMDRVVEHYYFGLDG